MPNLQKQIENLMIEMSSQVPQAILDIFQRSIEELKEDNIGKNSLLVGELMPSFNFKNTNEEEVSLDKSLGENKKLIIAFFRGNWCPFCSLELQALNKSFDKLQSKGFGLIAISPQTTQYNKEIKKNLKLNFEILSDAKSQYAKELGIDFTLQDYAVPHYKALGIDLKKLNADDQNRLPIPAVFVIDSNKVIKYKFVDSNYMNRVNIEELFTIE